MQRPIRVTVALGLLAFIVFAWYLDDNLIELIVRNREIVFGKYSRPGFGARFLITLVCGGVAALLLSRVDSAREMIARALLVTLSASLTVAVVLFGSYFLAAAPRYIEQQVAPQADRDVRWTGIIRHRPPNQHYALDFVDAPEQARSYPDAPPGYGIVHIHLTIDRFGFRNTDLQQHYPIVAVGDSFTAGSNVSDDQAWPVLLSRKLGTPIYNLGVSGTDPRVYLNNFATLGVHFEPRTAIFMIYEGNDFKYATPPPPTPGRPRPSSPSLGTRVERMAKASPVTVGLRTLSHEYLEKIGDDRPIPDWFDEMGWMPLAIETPRGFNYYSFRPKRLLYLYGTESALQERPQWQATSAVFDDIYRFTHKRHIRLIFVYVPSKPHVALAVAGAGSAPAEQLHRFLGYVGHQLPDRKTLERQVFARLGNQEKLFMDFCRKRGYECLSTTAALKAATADGVQAYYTYDQHFTPDGNRIVADRIADYLQHPAAPASKTR